MSRNIYMEENHRMAMATIADGLRMKYPDVHITVEISGQNSCSPGWTIYVSRKDKLGRPITRTRRYALPSGERTTDAQISEIMAWAKS
jgi:hypothetical protein